MKYRFILVLSCALGISFSLFYNKILIVQNPIISYSYPLVGMTEKIKKKVSFYYWDGKTLKSETHQLLLPEDKVQEIEIVIKRWLTILDEEKQTLHKVSLQLISLNAYGTELFISLDQLPFNTESSLYDKIQRLEGLLRTLRELSNIETVRLFVHHETPYDSHLDLSQSLQLSGYSTHEAKGVHTKQLCPVKKIMIDPVGDALYPGRCLGEDFERTVTLLCAQKLKEYIESNSKSISVIITHSPGEIVEPLQNAAFANRADVNLYISIYAYHEQGPASILWMFNTLYNPIELAYAYNGSSLDLCPYDHAYRYNIQASHKLAQDLAKAMLKVSSRGFMVEGPYAFPLRSLQGVKSTSLCCEFGLAKSQDWMSMVEALAKAIIAYSNT
ncbi:MAG TPA: hypothetical protein VHA52_01890 [Candidatus Babeliaceae bacterium]|nr:hypothetical protein [Candidatus Babeliaceae bacterium]